MMPPGFARPLSARRKAAMTMKFREPAFWHLG